MDADCGLEVSRLVDNKKTKGGQMNHSKWGSRKFHGVVAWTGLLILTVLLCFLIDNVPVQAWQFLQFLTGSTVLIWGVYMGVNLLQKGWLNHFKKEG